MSCNGIATTPPHFELSQIIACHGCDLLLERLPVKPGEKLFCPRCGELLLAPKNNSVNRSLALALSGLVLFPFAILQSIMSLDTMGFENSGNILDGVLMTFRDGYCNHNQNASHGKHPLRNRFILFYRNSGDDSRFDTGDGPGGVLVLN